MRIVRLSDLHRRRQRAASDLDVALERALDLRELGADFEAELQAANALASAFDPVSPPAEALVALRAAIAARKAAAARRRTRRVAWQTLPGALAAAAVGALAYVGLSGGKTQQPPSPSTNTIDVQRANQAIQQMNDRVQAVQNAGDPAAAAASAQEAKQALLQAQALAEQLPAYEATVRQYLIQETQLNVTELNSLLSRLHLQPLILPALPVGTTTSTTGQAAQALGGTTTSTTTAPSSTTSSSTTTSAPSSTTSTTNPVLVTATDAGKQPSESTTTTSAPPPTSTTTTAPPPPSTTSTTAPPAP